MRQTRLSAPAAILFCAALAVGLALPAAARAGRVLTLGIYLWTHGEDGAPTQSQYLSIAEGKTEVETDGKAGYKTATHATTEAESKLVDAAILDRMKALTLDQAPKLAMPYVTVEWHFSQDTGYAEGIAAYKMADLPKTIEAVQRQIFGATFDAKAK
ncbi:hypothetical protein [Acidimangrovimonas sediminis]|uniref:hypothetical protein n=1 Tax=Acidimangrovimonas sediminis TaxID=2056283 RepID=UPI000C8043FC|nr:hypothetical protein [Acidimangrovimonas sediminis]